MNTITRWPDRVGPRADRWLTTWLDPGVKCTDLLFTDLFLFSREKGALHAKLSRSELVSPPFDVIDMLLVPIRIIVDAYQEPSQELDIRRRRPFSPLFCFLIAQRLFGSHCPSLSQLRFFIPHRAAQVSISDFERLPTPFCKPF